MTRRLTACVRPEPPTYSDGYLVRVAVEVLREAGTALETEEIARRLAEREIGVQARRLRRVLSEDGRAAGAVTAGEDAWIAACPRCGRVP